MMCFIFILSVVINLYNSSTSKMLVLYSISFILFSFALLILFIRHISLENFFTLCNDKYLLAKLYKYEL